MSNIPSLSIVAVGLAVIAGFLAAVFLLIVIATGFAGFYGAGAANGFVIAAGSMVALLVIAIGIGVRALRRRGQGAKLVRSYLIVAVAELIAIAGFVAAAQANVGGARLPLVVALLVLGFVGGLIAWNLAIWRELREERGRTPDTAAASKS